MTDRAKKQPEGNGKRPKAKPATTRLVERAPADAIEPALMQSGNPPRAFSPRAR